MGKRIEGYSYEEFLSVADAIARGCSPVMMGRRMNVQQWRICDRLARFHQMSTQSDVESNMWREFREIVLMTRLAPGERNKIYDGEEDGPQVSPTEPA